MPTIRLRSKYRAVRSEWNGRTYASKAEMRYAQHLYDLRDKGAILDYVEQPRKWLGVPENVYVPDFLVIGQGGDAWYVDVKGMENATFRKNKKLWRKYGYLPLHVVSSKTLATMAAAWSLSRKGGRQPGLEAPPRSSVPRAHTCEGWTHAVQPGRHTSTCRPVARCWAATAHAVPSSRGP